MWQIRAKNKNNLRFHGFHVNYTNGFSSIICLPPLGTGTANQALRDALKPEWKWLYITELVLSCVKVTKQLSSALFEGYKKNYIAKS